jgi:putative hemolysin
MSLLLFILSSLLASCTSAATPEPPTPSPEGGVGLPNPASVFCLEQGGVVDIRSGDDGGQVGYCVFLDGSECEEWAFFRGECAPETTESPVITQTNTPMASECVLTAQSDIMVYQRPSLEAQVFGTLSAGEQVEIGARTTDGWLGFDPGVAQAGNVGVFRLRWVQEGAAFTLDGDCDHLPVAVGPSPGVCFTMAMTDTPVFSQPDASSDRTVTMQPPNDFAAVVGKTADDAWFKLDLSVGSLGIDQTGWLEAAMVNLNGPCEDFTIVPAD